MSDGFHKRKSTIVHSECYFDVLAWHRLMVNNACPVVNIVSDDVLVARTSWDMILTRCSLSILLPVQQELTVRKLGLWYWIGMINHNGVGKVIYTFYLFFFLIIVIIIIQWFIWCVLYYNRVSSIIYFHIPMIKFAGRIQLWSDIY